MENVSSAQTDSPPELVESVSVSPVAGKSPSSDLPPASSVSEILLRILSRLTVYQALPEAGSLVLSARDDIPMLDACCMFLPSTGSTSSADTTFSPWSSSTAVIEVLRTESLLHVSSDSPESRSRTLWELAKSRTHTGSDSLFARVLEKEAARVVSASATDAESVDPVGDFLSVFDVMYFLQRLLSGDSHQQEFAGMTVGQWVNHKRKSVNAVTTEDEEWIRFCERSTLVVRASLNLSHGIGHNQVISGSTMNMSTSNLLASCTGMDKSSGSGGVKSGGSSLVAVTQLLMRPWQLSLPLTVSTEKGVSAIFGYATLSQLMAHTALNCSDRILEPFFHMSVELADLLQVAAGNLEACAVLDLASSTVADAIEALAVNTVALLVTKEAGGLRSLITADDLMELLVRRLDTLALGQAASIAKINLSSLPCASTDAIECTLSESDFPMDFSVLLHKILSCQSGCIVVVNERSKPVALVTVKDVWSYVMEGATLSQ